MHKIYDQWPQQARKAYESEIEPIAFSQINHIVFAGMGGSGAIGDLFSAIFSKNPIHVTVVKGYLLPKTVDSKTLVIISSVSGNTFESISILNSAIDLDCKIIAFSSGGMIELICKQKNITHKKIQMYCNPRASFPSYVYSILSILKPIIPLDESSIEESISQMEMLSKKISTNNLTDSNPSLMSAKWIDEITLIYYPWGLQSAAIRFKNSIQENMKFHAMVEDVIEACHNGIMSWEKDSLIKPILITGIDDYVKTKERWIILKQYFDENKIAYKEIISSQGNILTKIVNLIYLLDFSTIYGAILHHTDPSPVKSIDFIKSKLN